MLRPEQGQCGSHTVSGEEQWLIGTALDHLLDGGPNRIEGGLEPAMKNVWLRCKCEVLDPVFDLERIGTGKSDDRRAVSFGDDETGAFGRQTGNGGTGAKGKPRHVPGLQDVIDLAFVRRLVSELRHPHQGLRVFQLECCRGRIETVQRIYRK